MDGYKPLGSVSQVEEPLVTAADLDRALAEITASKLAPITKNLAMTSDDGTCGKVDDGTGNDGAQVHSTDSTDLVHCQEVNRFLESIR